MEFLEITSPAKRKEIVEDYISTRNVIRKRNENNKESNLIKERELEAKVRPLIEATEKLPEKISDALIKTNLTNPLHVLDASSKANSTSPFHQSAYDYYMSNGMEKMRDKYFGIYEDDGVLKLGDAVIQIDDKNNIHINNRKFKTTQGLWDLIMLNKPKEYTNADLEEYRVINDMSNLRNNPRRTAKGSHKNTKKFKFLNRQIDVYPGLFDDEYGNSSDSSYGGYGFLPSDINSLKERLQLVCAERAAGNVSATTPEIVAILDEILRQGHLSKPEYNVVCKKLGC